MLHQLLVGFVMIVATTLIHAAGMSVALRWLGFSYGRGLHLNSFLVRSLVVATLIVILNAAIFFEAAVWGMTYLALGAFSDFEEALYFSTVTYTTLGYGDVVLEDRWRLLSSVEAANGLIIFAWTTALIIMALRRFSRLVRRIRSMD